MSILDEDGEAPVPAPSRIQRRTIADHLDGLADILTATPVGKLAIVAGKEVGSSGAVQPLVELAEALGAPVFTAPLHSTGVLPPTHPLFAGMLTPAAAAMRAALTPFERVFFVGGQPFMAYPYTDGSPLPDGTDLVHLSPDPTQLGRTYPVQLGLAGDPRATLAALLPLVRQRVDAEAARDALDAARVRRADEIESLEQAARDRYGATPIDPMAAAHALVRAMPPDVAVVDEAITTGVYVRGFHHWTEPGRYFFCDGGGLGWGMPAALGVSLAHDKRMPVLCAVGDGSAMYSPQALWTAAHERLPVVFGVFVNREYLILKNYLRAMKGESVRTGRYVAMQIEDPLVDYVALAASMGVDATRVDHADDIADVVKGALASGAPHVVEIPIASPE
jgi:benzoylformate decarboxylase